jgi:hypothetical protein
VIHNGFVEFRECSISNEICQRVGTYSLATDLEPSFGFCKRHEIIWPAKRSWRGILHYGVCYSFIFSSFLIPPPFFLCFPPVSFCLYLFTCLLFLIYVSLAQQFSCVCTKYRLLVSDSLFLLSNCYENSIMILFKIHHGLRNTDFRSPRSHVSSVQTHCSTRTMPIWKALVFLGLSIVLAAKEWPLKTNNKIKLQTHRFGS